VRLGFIYHYPETNGTEADMLDAGPLRDVAQAVERVGFTGLSLTEHPVPGARWLDSGGHQSLDPLVALGYAAAATTRLKLLTNLVVAPYRNPSLLAKAAATVDKLSGGRLILGLGAGYQKSEFYALGVDFEERNALFDEALDVLPLHWSGDPFSYHGRHFDARNVIARPRPVQDPIPIWIGGNSKLSRRRVATRAQGWMPMMGGAQLVATTRTVEITSLAQLAGMITEVRDAAAQAGRTDPIDVMSSYQDSSLATPEAEPDRHREAFAECEKAGITHLVISGRTRAPAETLEFIEAFGQAYLSPLAVSSPAGSSPAPSSPGQA
jgi:probable F420-dependent oxidoreductase